MHGMQASEEEQQQRLTFVKAAEENTIIDMNESIIFEEISILGESDKKKKKKGPLHGSFTDKFNNGDTVSYIPWIGRSDIMPTLSGLTKKLNPADKVVLWMGASVHVFQKKRRSELANWIEGGREGTVRNFLTEMKRSFPNAMIVYDTMQYVDLTLMGAHPAKKDTAEFIGADKKTPEYSATDERVCQDLKIAHTDRNKLGRFYRGLAMDGMHVGGGFGAAGGYAVWYDLVMQSGLSQACESKPANYCKDLDNYQP